MERLNSGGIDEGFEAEENIFGLFYIGQNLNLLGLVNENGTISLEVGDLFEAF